MAAKLSPWDRLKRWLEDRRIAAELTRLRRDGKLQAILHHSPYTYLRPGSFQGDDWYHVHLKGSASQQDIVFSCLHENRALWWIVEHYRKTGHS